MATEYQLDDYQLPESGGPGDPPAKVPQAPKSIFPDLTDIVIGGAPPPLQGVNDAIRAKKDIDQTQRNLNLSSAPGWVPKNEPTERIKNELSASLTKAKEQERSAIEEVAPLIGKIAKEAFSSGIDNFTIVTPSGNKELDPDKIEKVASDLNKKYGGGDYSKTLLRSQINAIGNNEILRPEIEWKAKSQISKLKLTTPEELRQRYASFISQVVSKTKADVDTVVKDRDAELSRISEMRDNALEYINGKYEYEYLKIKKLLTGDAIAEKENNIFQFKSGIDADIKEGRISRQEGQELINDYVAQEEEGFKSMTQSGIDLYAKQRFDEQFGRDMKTELASIAKPFAEQAREIQVKARERYERLQKETNTLLKKSQEEFPVLAKEILEEDAQKVAEVYQKAADEVLKDRIKNDEVYRIAQDAMSRTPGLSAQKLGYLFGSSFKESVGNFGKNIGQFLEANGVGGWATEFLIGKGGSLAARNRIYKPEIGAGNFIQPSFLAQSLGNTLGTLAPIAVTSAITANPYVGGAIGAMSGAAANAGDSYNQMIEDGVSPSEAGDRVNQQFATNFALSAIPDMLTARMFGAAFRTAKGAALKSRDMAAAATGEYIQETSENALGDVTVDPTKDFVNQWLSGSNQKAGLEAALGTAVFGGFSSGASTLVQSLKDKKVPGVISQWQAKQILDGWVDRSKMIAEISLFNGEINEDQFTEAINEINKTEQKVNDAKNLGLTDEQTLAYVGYSAEADQAKKTASEIQDPTLRKAAEEKAEALQKEANEIVKGNTPVGAIDIGGLGNIAAKEADAKAINEEVAAEIEKIQPEVQESLEDSDVELMAALHDHKKQLTGPIGEAVAQRLDDYSKFPEIVAIVKDQIESDPKAAEKIFGKEVVGVVAKAPEPAFTPNPNLTDEQRQVEDKFGRELFDNYEDSKKRYQEKFGNEINTDNARTLSEDYNNNPAENVAAAHAPASAFTTRMLNDAIAEPTKTGQALFTAGGTGAGKSTALKAPGINEIASESDFIFDSNLDNEQDSIAKIDKTLASGRNVTVSFIYRDPVEAFEKGVIDRMHETGRPLPVDYHLKKHKDSFENIKKLQEHYKDNPNVGFLFVDNSLGRDKAQVVPFEEIEKKAYLSNDASKQLYDTIDAKFRSGEISEAQHRALKGSNARRSEGDGAQGMDEKGRGTDGSQPEQSGQSRQNDLRDKTPIGEDASQLDQQQADEDQRQKRSEFLNKIDGKDNKTSDFEIYSKLPKEKKRIKLDAIAKKVQAAKDEGVITEDDFNALTERINRDYESLGDVKAAKAKKAPAAEPKQEAGDKKATPAEPKQKAEEPPQDAPETDEKIRYARSNSYKFYKQKFPEDTQDEYNAFRAMPDPDVKDGKPVSKEAAKRIADRIRSLKINKDPNTLQSNVLGVPQALWNAFVETVAKLTEGGINLAEAVKQALAKHDISATVQQERAVVKGLKANLGKTSEKDNFNQKNINEERDKTGLGNGGAMESNTLFDALEKPERRSGIYKTIQAANTGGVVDTVRDAEEREELESRGINPDYSKTEFRKKLRQEAEANGVWFEKSYLSDKELKHDRKKNDTSENDVYKNADGKTLTKLNNLSYVKGAEHEHNLLSFIDRLEAHNNLFPNVAYKIRGFMDNKEGVPSLVLEQPEVSVKRNATQQEIDNYLTSIGFKKDGTRNWSNGHQVWSNGQYELFDARPANVLVGKDDRLYFVDTIPHSVSYLETPSENRILQKTPSNDRRSKENSTIRGLVGERAQGERVYQTLWPDNQRGSNSLAAKNRQRGWNKESFLGELDERAKEKGSWISDISPLTKNPIKSGQEQEVYLSKDEKTVIKVNNLSLLDGDDSGSHTRDFSDFIDRLDTHNKTFGSVPYQIIGFAKNSKGEISVVLQQPYIKNARYADLKTIYEYLRDNGFKPKKLANGVQGFTNEKVEISDVKPENVLQDEDGNLRFIDTDISSVAFLESKDTGYDETLLSDYDQPATSKQIADKIRSFKSKGDRLHGGMLGVATAVYDGMLEMAATLIEQGASIADVVKAAINYIKANDPDSKFTDKEIKTAVESEFVEIGLIESEPKRGDAKRNINQQTKKSPTTGKVSFRDLFKKRIKAERNAAKVIKGLQEEVYQYFKEAGTDLKKAKVARAIKRMQGLTKLNDPAEALLDVIDDIDDIINEQKTENAIADVNVLAKKFRKMIKKSSVTPEINVNFFKQLSFPSASSVYKSMGTRGIEAYAGALTEMLSGFGTRQGVRNIDKAQIQRLFDKLNGEVGEYQQRRLADRVNNLIILGKLPKDTTIADYLAMKEAEKSAETQEDGQKEYRDIVASRQEDLKEVVGDIEHPTSRAEATELSEIPVSELNANELSRLNDIINNIINDGDIDGAGEFLVDVKDKKEGLKAIEKIEVRAAPTFLRQSIASLRGFTNLFHSITRSTAAAAQVRAAITAKMERGINKKQARMIGTKSKEGVAKEFLNILKKNKIDDPKKEYRLSVFAFLNQAVSKDETSRQEDFEIRLDKLISSGVEKLYKEGAMKTNKPRRDSMIGQAEHTAEALKSMGLIKDYEVTKNSITVERVPSPGIEDMKLDPGEHAVYEYTQSKWAEIVDDLERVARSVWGVDFKRHVNYSPMIARAFGPQSASIDEVSDIDSMDIFGEMPKRLSSQPTDRMKKRGELAGDDKYYHMGFVDVFLNAYDQAISSIEAGRGIRRMAKIVNSKTFGDWVVGKLMDTEGGKNIRADENLKIFRDQMKRWADGKKQAPYLYSSSGEFAKTLMSKAISYMYSTYLHNIGQLVKQYVPNILATGFETGVPALQRAMRMQIESVVSPTTREKYNEFLSNFSGIGRSAMGMEMHDEYINSPKILKNKVARGAADVLSLANKPGKWALTIADKGAFNVTIIAAYMKYMKRNGMIDSYEDFTFDKAIKSFDENAMAYAETVSGRVNADSSKAERAKVINRRKDEDGEAIGSVLHSMYMLQSFALNAFMEVYDSVRVLTGNRSSTGERIEASRHLMTYATQVLSFHLLKELIVKPGYSLVADSLMPSLYDFWPDDDDDEEEKKAAQREKIIYNAAADALLAGFPAPLQTGAKLATNNLLGKFDIERKYYTGDGLFGGADLIFSGADIADRAFSESQNSHLSDELNMAVDKNDWWRLAALLLKSGDLFTLSNAMDKSLKGAK